MAGETRRADAARTDASLGANLSMSVGVLADSPGLAGEQSWLPLPLWTNVTHFIGMSIWSPLDEEAQKTFDSA